MNTTDTYERVWQMKRILIILVLTVLLCFSYGCTYWYQEGTSFEDCESDLMQCYRELIKYSDMDIIGPYEIDFMKNCMKQKGYRLVGEDKLPYKVKRQDPHSDTFWVIAGVSGTLEE